MVVRMEEERAALKSQQKRSTGLDVLAKSSMAAAVEKESGRGSSAPRASVAAGAARRGTVREGTAGTVRNVTTGTTRPPRASIAPDLLPYTEGDDDASDDDILADVVPQARAGSMKRGLGEASPMDPPPQP